PSNQGPNGPNLGEMYGNMRYGISQWDASDKGFDLTGTVTETSDSDFSHKEQLSQSSEDLMRMDGGSKVGAVKFDASSLEEISRETDSDLKITHEAGSGFKIDKASDEVKTNHKWTDKQIRSRSEHREYDTPTASPPTTMAALRNSNPTSNQSLLGDLPSGSQLVLSATNTTLYYSPLSDVTKTVKNWIAPYESDGSPNAAPILYHYLDEVEVDVTASVSKTGYHFNGSSTLHSKSTFTETDIGTNFVYRGLERQEPSSLNNWTDTFVSVESHTGGINQSITHTKPAADNTITIPNQGTNTTVAPGGEHHSGTSLLSTYRTVQKPLADFVGQFSTKTGYVSNSATTSNNGGADEGGYSQTGGTGAGGTQDEGTAASVSLGDLPNLSDEELENTIKLFFYMHEGLTPEFAAFQAMSKDGFIQVSFYRSPSYWFDTRSGTSSRNAKTGETIWTIHLDRNEIEENGLAWAVSEFRKRLESLNDPLYGDRTFRSKRALFADGINAASLSATPSAANSTAQDAYFSRLSNEKAVALSAAAVAAEAALIATGDAAVLVIRITPKGDLLMAVVDMSTQGITWQTTVGLGAAALGVGAVVVGLKAADNGADAINLVRQADNLPITPNSGVFGVAKHGDMPSPRPGQQSHHGAMSAWMKEHFPGYDPNKAPAILMPEANHRATFGVYNTWRAEMRQRLGGTFDWSKVSESEMRSLSEKMFDAAQVPGNIRQEYWDWFIRMQGALSK
ncbi:MAG: hypothetical protein Q8M16_13790, partial [Pirellulaceae bacterium]|nr:hypothetical protein [Pirellulaceae bacterium]